MKCQVYGSNARYMREMPGSGGRGREVHVGRPWNGMAYEKCDFSARFRVRHARAPERSNKKMFKKDVRLS